MIEFSIVNADTELSNIPQHSWNFGDGTTGASQGGAISRDYADALVRDSPYTNSDFQADARYANGVVASAKRTIAVFYTYVALQNPVILPSFFLFPGEVICLFTVTNLEDEDLSFTAEKHEWLSADLSENPASIVADEIVVPKVVGPSSKAIGVKARMASDVATIDLRVPARSTITVSRTFSPDSFTKNIFGVAIHLGGVGMCSKLPAISSVYIE